MNITVYLGALEGNDPALAESVLNAGGQATGVETQFFVDVYGD